MRASWMERASWREGGFIVPSGCLLLVQPLFGPPQLPPPILDQLPP